MSHEELKRVHELKKKICGLEKTLHDLRVASENLVPILDGLPHSTLARSRVEAIALKIVERGREKDTLCALLPTVKAELADTIMREVSEPIVQTLLILRYVECCPFKDIARRMRYALRAVFKIHERALKECTTVHIDAQKPS